MANIGIRKTMLTSIPYWFYWSVGVPNMQNDQTDMESGVGSVPSFSSWTRVLDNLEVGVTVISPEMRLEYINETYRKLVDIPPFIDAGCAAFDLFHFIATRGDYGAGEPEEIANKRLRSIVSGEWCVAVQNLKNGKVRQRGQGSDRRRLPRHNGDRYHREHAA